MCGLGLGYPSAAQLHPLLPKSRAPPFTRSFLFHRQNLSGVEPPLPLAPRSGAREAAEEPREAHVQHLKGVAKSQLPLGVDFCRSQLPLGVDFCPWELTFADRHQGRRGAARGTRPAPTACFDYIYIYIHIYIHIYTYIQSKAGEQQREARVEHLGGARGGVEATVLYA